MSDPGLSAWVMSTFHYVIVLYFICFLSEFWSLWNLSLGFGNYWVVYWHIIWFLLEYFFLSLFLWLFDLNLGFRSSFLGIHYFHCSQRLGMKKGIWVNFECYKSLLFFCIEDILRYICLEFNFLIINEMYIFLLYLLLSNIWIASAHL